MPKFASMLSTGHLWFTRAAGLLDDPYEGLCEAAHREFPPDEYGPGPIEVQRPVEISLERVFAELGYYTVEACKNARDHLYVNSWCLASESMAMWQIYSSLAYGVAVKSSVGQYQLSLKLEPLLRHQFMFGKVKYHDDLSASSEIRRDFSDGAIPMGSNFLGQVLTLGLHKRSCYKHENEWRAALYQDLRPEVPGVQIPVDLEQLISAVYIGPRSEDFFIEVVSSIMDKFELRKPVERSPLLVPPAKPAVPRRPATA
ncbi:MAG: DUF2971 domain-containing protein [Acidobacteriia bacterium]|nr:DUF2971 domain-containing protein [Terriglobia bacterium]